MEICNANPLNNTKPLPTLETEAEILDWFIKEGKPHAIGNLTRSIWEYANTKKRVSPKQMRYVHGCYLQAVRFQQQIAKRVYGHEWQKAYDSETPQQICKHCSARQ